MAVIIDTEKCTGCSLCLKKCPYGAVEIVDKLAVIGERCVSCGACIDSCPVDAIASDRPPREPVDPAEYKDIWVLAEQKDCRLNRTTFELLGCARGLAEGRDYKVTALLLGKDIESLAGDLFAHGADTVCLAEHDELADYRTLPYARVLADLIRDNQPAVLLCGATHQGRDLAPRLAARLDLGLTADCTKLAIGEDGHLLQTRPAFGGNVMATIVSPYARPQMATVRPGIMEALEPDASRTGEIVRIETTLLRRDLVTRIIGTVQADKDKVEFHKARVIVSGGRGVGCEEGFKKLRELADIMNAELGGTRVAVESGWIPYERQIGQTGRSVRPELYIACGISGAIQHRAGIIDSRYIVSINRDPDAPIHQVADFRLIGDLNKIVPALTKVLAEKIQQEEANAC